MALLVSGASLALTGEFDLAGLYGERFVFAIELGAAGFALWGLGEMSGRERHACWFTLASAALSLALFPGGSRLEFYGAVWLVHIGLCWQLFAWARVARKAQARGLWIMLAGMACETFVILPIGQLTDVDAACVTAGIGTRLTCLTGSGYVAMGLPALITVLLILFWLNPIERALRGRGRR